MQFRFGALTDIGRKREQNQDNMAARPDLGLFVVADGMGGHRGGETASAISAEVIVRSVERSNTLNPPLLITEAIQAANQAIFEKALHDPGLQGMGTTTTALLFREGKLTIGHVGDSRCYFFKRDAVWQATRDHSLVQEKLRAGLITREEVKTDRMKNVITRSVGFEPEVNVEVYEMPVQAGDIFMICSDGLSGLMEDSQMLEIVQRNLIEKNDANEAVRELVAAANTNGGDDNITSILVEVL